MDSIDDTENFEAGKETEAYIAKKLRNMGYTVTDISTEQLRYSNDVLYYSPFDILAEFKMGRRSYSFLADIKLRRNGRATWYLDHYKVNEYMKYDRRTADDKIVIFVCPNRPDCYIHVETIPEVCYTLGPRYHIERHQTITLVGLRKKLEETYTKYLLDD